MKLQTEIRYEFHLCPQKPHVDAINTFTDHFYQTLRHKEKRRYCNLIAKYVPCFLMVKEESIGVIFFFSILGELKGARAKNVFL